MHDGSAEDNLDAKDLMLKKFPSKISALEADLSSFVDGIRKEAEDQAQTVNSESKAFNNFMILLGAFLFISLVVAIFIVISKIAGKLSDLQTDLISSVDQTGSASESVFSISQTLASSATQQAASLEETIASMDQISSSIKLSTTQVSYAADATEESQKIARQSHNDMTALLTKMNAILESSKKVEQIISVIEDIAFQTNLLALNASVEAARAGEQGRGFAVVADAVRNLASKTAESAKEITGLIKQSCQNIDDGVLATKASAAQINRVVELINKSAELSRSISETAIEQQTAVTSINDSLNEFDETSQSLAAAAESASDSATSLRGQSQNLRVVGKKLAEVIEG
jgi:hypothetical protein